MFKGGYIWAHIRVNVRPQQKIEPKVGDGPIFHSGPFFAKVWYIFFFLFDVAITNGYILLSPLIDLAPSRILLGSIAVVAIEVVEGLSSTCFPFGTIPLGWITTVTDQDTHMVLVHFTTTSTIVVSSTWYWVSVKCGCAILVTASCCGTHNYMSNFTYKSYTFTYMLPLLIFSSEH